MEITNNGILMTTDYQGRSSGEAYVQFSSKNDAERALEKNKQSIGHRLVGRALDPGLIFFPPGRFSSHFIEFPDFTKPGAGVFYLERFRE